MGRTIVVGDIHGCALEFDDLLRSVGFAPGVDRLVLVGDLVARGPDSAGVVELARSCGALAVRGNHDEKVLSWWRHARDHGKRSADRKVKLSERHRAVVEALTERQFTYLAALPLMIALPEHEMLVVHAGVDPSKTPTACDEETLLTVRSIDDGGRASRKLTGTPWAQRWRGPQQIVFGHDARRNLQLEEFATGLDTGCCYGRQLSAMVLARDEAIPRDRAARRRLLTNVPARQAWCPTGDGDGPE
jgi:hypothetical protein